MPVNNSEIKFKSFLEHHPVKKFNKGEILIFQGEAPRSAYIVKSGIIKAYNISVNGDEKPVAFYEENSVFPAAWVYGRLSSAVYYYEAFSKDVEVYVIDRQELVNFIKKSPDILYMELEKLLSDQIGGSLRLNALQHSRASDKLIYTLHYLALTHGESTNTPNVITINLNLTHQDFANLTGLTRETAATELNKLKKLKIIEYGKNQPYTLNVSNLYLLQNDQFISDLKPSKLSF